MPFDYIKVTEQAAGVAIVGGLINLGVDKYLLRPNNPERQVFGQRLSGDTACAISTGAAIFLGEVSHVLVHDNFDESGILQDFSKFVGPALAGGYSVAIDKVAPVGNPDRPAAMSFAKGAVVDVLARYASENVLTFKTDALKTN